MSFDVAVRSWMLAHQHPALTSLFHWITVLGGILGMRVLAVLGVLLLVTRRRWIAACGLLVAPVLSELVFRWLKDVVARERPPSAASMLEDSYAFPSGHATVSAATCATLAWLLWRAGLIGPRVAVAIAFLAPLLVGVSRLYLDVHWATDVVGGWCIGLLVAAVCVAPNELQRRRRAAEE